MSKDISNAKWHMKIRALDEQPQQVSLPIEDTSWKRFVTKVNLGDVVTFGDACMPLYIGEIGSECSMDGEGENTKYVRKLVNVHQITVLDFVRTKDFDGSSFLEIDSVNPMPTCPNCGYEIELMSHGICVYCEQERLHDKYLYV